MNIPQQSSRGGGGGGGASASASATKKQGGATVDFSTYDNNEVSGSRSGSGSGSENENIAFHDHNHLKDPFQYLTDDDFIMDVDLDSSIGNILPTPDDPSQNVYLPLSQQELEQASWTPFATPSTTSIHGENLGISEDSVGLPAAFKAIGGALNRPTDSYKSPTQATGNEKPIEVHDCETYALILLRWLHHWPLYSPDKHNQACVASETCLANSSANPEVLHSLDTILYANKSVLSGVVKLLDCSCAQRPHLATLYMSIITKMLSLYEIAGTTNISSSDCPSMAPPASPTHNLSGPCLARNTIMQVGVFDLDEEDQTTLQHSILLRQLRKIERAIEKFASLGGGDANDHDTSIRQWRSMAISMIKKELQRIYQNCKQRLLVIA